MQACLNYNDNDEWSTTQRMICNESCLPPRAILSRGGRWGKWGEMNLPWWPNHRTLAMYWGFEIFVEKKKQMQNTQWSNRLPFVWSRVLIKWCDNSVWVISNLFKDAALLTWIIMICRFACAFCFDGPNNELVVARDAVMIYMVV